jgi:hypothetical protein
MLSAIDWSAIGFAETLLLGRDFCVLASPSASSEDGEQEDGKKFEFHALNAGS